MSDAQYVEMDIRVRARVRIPAGQYPTDIIEAREDWECGVVNELQSDLAGGDVKQYFEKVACDIDVVTDPNWWEFEPEGDPKG